MACLAHQEEYFPPRRLRMSGRKVVTIGGSVTSLRSFGVVSNRWVPGFIAIHRRDGHSPLKKDTNLEGLNSQALLEAIIEGMYAGQVDRLTCSEQQVGVQSEVEAVAGNGSVRRDEPGWRVGMRWIRSMLVWLGAIAHIRVEPWAVREDFVVPIQVATPLPLPISASVPITEAVKVSERNHDVGLIKYMGINAVANPQPIRTG